MHTHVVVGAHIAPTKKAISINWLNEPLLHFVLLGGLLFAIDHWLFGRGADAHTIVVGPAVDSEAIEAFEESRGRKPNVEELKALHQVWLDNEVLYREGLAMQVDKGDDAIRERVIFKALSVIDANVKLPVASESMLREWFAAHRAKYDEPARYDFEEASLAGENDEATLRKFVVALNSGTPGDAQAGLRVFKARPEPSLIQSYGSAFPGQLAALTPGTWHAVHTNSGWRAMRLVSLTTAKPAVFDNLAGVIMQDWKDATAAEQRSEAVHALAKKYQIKFEKLP